jgi:hypothetical protein
MRIVGLAAVLVAALVATGVGLAGSPGKERIARTAAGNTQARAEVLHRVDVGTGWKGGFIKPDLSSSLGCSSYRPKQSDLVLVGVAETRFTKAPIQVDSEAQVLRTATMVRRDWRRTVLDRRVLPCLRQGFVKALGSGSTLVSFRRIAFPRVARLTRAFRLVANVETASGTVAVEIDFVAMGIGRNELTLTISGPASLKTTIHATEVLLARHLAHRVR